MAAELVQIFYHEDHLKELYPFAIPYDNRGKLTVFFENDVIRKVVMETTADKIGVCSWKLKAKQRGFYIGRPKEITQEVIEGDYDILSFTKNTKYHTMLASATQSHKFFQPTFDKILAHIGKTRPGEVKNPIYQNHFVARTDIYQDYVKNWLQPAISAIEGVPEIRELAYQDSNYSELSGQSAAILKSQLGISYYPMVPFLLERLFSVYAQVMKIKVTYNDQTQEK